MSERLQKGGPKRMRPASEMSFGDKMRHPADWWKRRHAAKKRRLAAMTRKRRVWRRVGILATWLLAGVAIVMVVTVALFYTLTNVPRPENLALPQVARILYSNGTTLTTFGDQNRTIIHLDQVPQMVRWEVLAAEDRGFYSEPGVSIKGTIRAVASDLTGGDTQGGSGITQQYVKNAYLNDSRTLSRKLKELMIAVKLSRQYSKDQILEFYLNRVYFGRGAYGIEAAAQTYFGKDISKIDVAQGAVLAALLRAPSYYDPAENPTAARGRWQYVLDGMVATKHLTKDQEAALVYPTRSLLKPRSAALGATGWAQFIQDQVLAELQAHGISQDDIKNKGMTIQTTIDPKAQSAAVSAITQTFSNLTKQQRNMKNALVAINPHTGGVLAYYGGPNGKNYAGVEDDVDYAGVGARPPGSSFKPYTLATALTATLQKKPAVPHYTIDSYVDGSKCVTITGVRICNDPSDPAFSSVQIKKAMFYSLNTTFDQMAEAVGPDNVAATAHAAGVSKTIGGKPTLVNSDGSTGFGIGIGDYAVHPLDQAVGFATFANNGVANAPYFVQKVTASDGSIVYEHKAHPVQAFDPRVANDVTLTLEPIAQTNGPGLDNGRTAAAKTGTEGVGNGTTNQNSDAWMVGYTPQVSVAVWVGSGDSRHAINDSSGGPEYGRDLPAQTWDRFLNTYLANKPNLPMADHQMITGGQSTAPKPTPTKSATKSSTTPAPSFSRSTGFSSLPPPSTTAVTTPPATPTPTCTPPGTPLNPCP